MAKKKKQAPPPPPGAEPAPTVRVRLGKKATVARLVVGRRVITATDSAEIAQAEFERLRKKYHLEEVKR